MGCTFLTLWEMLIKFNLHVKCRARIERGSIKVQFKCYVNAAPSIKYGLCLVCVFHCVTNARLHAIRSEFLCPSSCRAQCACWNHDSFLNGVREGIPAVVKGCQIYSWTAQAISVGRTWDVAVRANCKGTVWKSWNYKRLCAGFHGRLIVDNSWFCVDVLPPLFQLEVIDCAESFKFYHPNLEIL